MGGVLASLLLGTVAVASLGGVSRAERPGLVSKQRMAAARGEPPTPRVRGGRPPALTARMVWAEPRRRFVPVGRLRIPRLRLSTAFFVGVHSEVVALGPGLWPGTPMPGSAGNSVLAGHRTTHTRPFANLDLLRRGDLVRARPRGRRWTPYRVIETKVVPEAIYARVVLAQPRAPRARVITLFACTPKGERTHRIVVRARARRAPRSGPPVAAEETVKSLQSRGR